MAEIGRDCFESRKVCCRNFEEIQNDGLQIHDYADDDELKLFGDTTSERVDATLYRQMIGSLMYLTNMRPDICFAVNTLS